MIVQALLNLRPNAEWDLLDGEIFWKDVVQTQPTVQELQTEIARLQAEYTANEYQRKRAVEYPDFREYLDGVVKGDQVQIQAYIDACQAVKAKYPKGE